MFLKLGFSWAQVWVDSRVALGNTFPTGAGSAVALATVPIMLKKVAPFLTGEGTAPRGEGSGNPDSITLSITAQDAW